MSEPRTRITREELHGLVWSKPFVRLSAELGYSYAELVAVCRAFAIPRPTGGYWYRKTHGGAEDPTPLPPPPVGASDDIPLGSRGSRSSAVGMESNPKSTDAMPESVESQSREVKEPVAVASKPGNIAAPSYEPLPITRAELYEKVWKTTLKQLAAEWRTTHSEIVRVCEALGVPRPDQSYWARWKLGMPVNIPPLPDLEPGVKTDCLLRRKGAKEPKPGMPDVVTPAAGEPATVESKPAKDKWPTKVEYTRQQLFDAVWSKSGVKLAAELGISDVALAKTCRRMGIPRPARGYWARIEAGERIRRPTLPDSKGGQKSEVTFHVAANVERREAWALSTPPSSLQGVRCKAVELPPEGSELHPIALRHQEALQRANAKELGYVACKAKNLFQSELSASLVPVFVRALSALLWELEDRDYEFKSGSEEYHGLRICRDNDDLTLRWSEATMVEERQPTQQEKRRPSWTWQLKETKPTGQLGVEIMSPVDSN